MERVRHQLACANCMLANTNLPVNKDYHFLSKIISNYFIPSIDVTKRQHMLRHILSYVLISHSSFELAHIDYLSF